MKDDAKPWLNEPDYKRWRDGKTQLMCLILRAGTTGALCGYVRLPRALAKRAIGRNRGYGVLPFASMEVHGGLTYSGRIRTTRRGRERGVWVGFDCAHWGDMAPGLALYTGRTDGTYRGLAYVTEQVRWLASQIRELAP